MTENLTSLRREDVHFDTGAGRCAAWLYHPDPARGPEPVVILGHGLGGVREMRLDAVAERFAAAGYACLVFDYRHFGASDGEPRQLLDIETQLADWAAAVAFVRTREDLDDGRIVLWGTSFGGGHVLLTAARDRGRPPIAAVISQCPFTDGYASGLKTSPITALKVLRLALADLRAARRGRPPVTVPTAGAPGTAALMAAPDALPGYLALVPKEPHTFHNHVAARFGMAILRHRPGLSTPYVSCPVLVCVCDTDTVAPPKPTVRHARRAPRAEIVHYPVGHFDIYLGADFEIIIADQLAFLARHVPPASRP